jgi:hypothetical protein
VPLASWASVGTRRKRRVGDRRERLRIRRPRFRGTACPQRVVRCIQSLNEDCGVFGGDSSAKHQRAVLVPMPVKVGGGLGFGRFLGRDTAVSADSALELGGGQLEGEPEQLLLRHGLRDPRQRPHLRVRELAAPEGGSDARQLRQPARDADVLARCSRRQPAAPGEPLGRGAAGEGAPPVELGHQLQPAASAGVEVRGERRELILELAKR